MSSNNVKEGTKFAFDLNIEPVDETLDINVEHVDEENRDALNPVDEENHNSMNPVDEENLDSPNPIDEKIHDSPNDSYTPGDLDSCSICRGTLVNENDIQRTLVTLKCAHKFHLDCIGSAYNAKGFMECPNCRSIEPGEWRFANGTHFNADNMIANDDEQEEDNDPGCFSQLIVKSEVCPFGCLGQRYPFDRLQCLYVECSFYITEYFTREVSESSYSSSQEDTNIEEVPNPIGSPVIPPFTYRSPYPLFPHIPVPSNRNIFWSFLRPGVMRARHYLSHPFFNHSLLGRSGISMINAPMASSYASSSTTQLNPSNVWESTQPFLSQRHHFMVEYELYRMIYGDRNEMGEGSGNDGGSGSNGNNDDGGSGNFGGNGNGNVISG
ncbi:Zinc finger RING-type [Arabidopsis thaliana x Arabidopsis arenosa]|uniref:Zinc finger RING-type n=1 Tax=Arabidopsis thaliana x Arabidopsis arenosa TaxID=1240361 RepID=A0A8T2AY58_9BRAS|nr:Zinc finger RING-type [Arabidopsis thaliana x Arabidopsis arenosa]